MKLLFTFLLSIQIFSMSSPAQANNESELKEVQSELGLKQLTPGLIKVILSNPLSIPYLKKSAKLANILSERICKVEGEPRHTRDEVDAVRHFLLATLLTYYINPKFTRAFLTAHEQRGAEYNSENYMDLSNNELGIQYGEKIKTMEIEDIYETFHDEIMNRVQTTGELFVLDSGDSFCANSSLFPTIWEIE